MKTFISANSLQLDSFRLAAKIPNEKVPDYLVALWRGGSFIGCCVHEFLKRKFPTKDVDHIPIRTSRYIGIGEAAENIEIFDGDYLKQRVKPGQRILIVDDVWDAGTTIDAVITTLQPLGAIIEVAVVHYKPKNNKIAGKKPDYYISETDSWLVYPHELEGLTDAELSNGKTDGAEIHEWLKK